MAIGNFLPREDPTSGCRERSDSRFDAINQNPDKIEISGGGGVKPPRPPVECRVRLPGGRPLFSFDYLVGVWTMRRFIGRIWHNIAIENAEKKFRAIFQIRASTSVLLQ